MRRSLKIVAFVLLLLGGGFIALALHPPAMLRVAANYSAKVVCSNVFIARREAQRVLNEDVQAPGHPLLRLMRVSVDRQQQRVHAGLLGVIGNGLAQHRPGRGCTVVADGKETALPPAGAALPALPAPPPDLPWPSGSGATIAPAVQALLADDALVGETMRGVVVIHRGTLVAQRYSAGFSAQTPLLGWSMTKSVTAALLGMQIGDGHLRLAQAGFWPDPTDARNAITLADMMAMGDGLDFNEGYGDVSDVTRMLYLEPDMAAYVKSRPLAHAPGSTWNYSSGTSVLLSSIWQQAAGEQAANFPRQRLFAPLGMHSAVLEADAHGTFVGSSYLYASAQDWARFGQFLLQEGVWEGQRLLPAGYVALLRSPFAPARGQYAQGQLWRWGPQGDTPEGQNPDLPFALPADTFWMLGHDGQAVAIVPSKQLVLVRLGLTPRRALYKPQALLAKVIAALP